MAPEGRRTKAEETVIEGAASLDGVLAALAQCEGDCVLLVSPAGAAISLGVLFFRKLVDLAAARFPGKTVRGRLDCGDRPGLALAAFRHGLDASVDIDDDRFRRLQAIACASGVRAVRGRGQAPRDGICLQHGFSATQRRD